MSEQGTFRTNRPRLSSRLPAPLVRAVRSNEHVLGLWRSAREVGVDVRSRVRRRQTPAIVDRYMAAPGPKLVQLGSGSRPRAGWLCTDLVLYQPDVAYLDVTARFPFADASIDAFHGEHLVEHLPLPAGRLMMRECLRTLRPGGVLRLATPDLTAIARLVADPDVLDDPEARHFVDVMPTVAIASRTATYGARPVDVLNLIAREWGHQFLYDEATLTSELLDAGFATVERVPVGESEHPDLHGIETHGTDISDDRIERFGTLVIEATRP